MLSERELQVFCYTAVGMTLSEIGSVLCLSNKTVATYAQRCSTKLSLKSTADFVRMAMTYGFLYDGNAKS